MDLQNTPFTVQLGGGARIRFSNAVINTGAAGATIQFGSFEPVAVAAPAQVPARRAAPQLAEVPARRIPLPTRARKEAECGHFK